MSEGILSLFQRTGPSTKIHFLAPAQWHCLINRTPNKSTLYDWTQWATRTKESHTTRSTQQQPLGQLILTQCMEAVTLSGKNSLWSFIVSCKNVVHFQIGPAKCACSSIISTSIGFCNTGMCVGSSNITLWFHLWNWHLCPKLKEIESYISNSEGVWKVRITCIFFSFSSAWPLNLWGPFAQQDSLLIFQKVRLWRVSGTCLLHGLQFHRCSTLWLTQKSVRYFRSAYVSWG